MLAELRAPPYYSHVIVKCIRHSPLFLGSRVEFFIHYSLAFDVNEWSSCANCTVYGESLGTKQTYRSATVRFWGAGAEGDGCVSCINRKHGIYYSLFVILLLSKSYMQAL